MVRQASGWSRRVSIPLLLVMLAALLTACSRGDDAADDMSLSGESGRDAPAMVVDEEYAGASVAPQADPVDADSSAQIALDRLVIRTAQITLAVDNTTGAAESVRILATFRGGFVFASSSYVENEREYAQLTLRVPADQYDATISELRTAPYVTTVVREESSSQDVSAEYVDNESRLTALEETQRRYLSLLSEAESVDEILRLETELTRIRTEVETITGRQNYLDEMTSYSTITVHLRPAGAEEHDPDDEFSVLRIAESAWDRSTGALAGVAEALIVVVIFAVFFAPLGLAVYLLFRFVRRRTMRTVE